MELVALLQTRGVAACGEQLEEVVRRRCAPSLALKAIVTDRLLRAPFWARSTHQTQNPFDKLPQGVVQEVLSAFLASHGEGDDPEEELLPPAAWNLAALLLRAARPTELDLSVWQRRLRPNYERLQRLVLRLCPWLQVLALTTPCAPYDLEVSHETRLPDRHDPLVLRLEHLRVLRLRQLLEPSVACHLSSLRVLEFCILEVDLSQLVYVTWLTNLRELYLNVWEEHDAFSEVLAATLAALVARMEGLEAFGSSALHRCCYGTDFVAALPAQRPRPLLLDALTLEADSRRLARWPRYLRLRKFLLDEHVDAAQARHMIRLLPARHLRVLELLCLHDPRVVHALLDALAKHVSRLTVQVFDGGVDFSPQLDCHLALAAAPNAKTIFLGNLTMRPGAANLKPEHEPQAIDFTNVEGINIDMKRKSGSEGALFEAFLLGSEACRELLVRNSEALRTTLATLQTHPECGVRWRKLDVTLEDEHDLPIAMQVAALVVLRAPELQRVEFGCDHGVELHRQDLEAWFTDLLAATDVKFELSVASVELYSPAYNIKSSLYGQKL